MGCRGVRGSAALGDNIRAAGDMTLACYFLVLISAAVSVTAAVTVFWKNQHRTIGPLFGLSMLLFAGWLFGFSHLFLPPEGARASLWARLTLTAAVLMSPVWFHTLCKMAERTPRFRWWITGAYVSAGLVLARAWSGHFINSATQALFMMVWPLLGFGVALARARVETGYRRTQLRYCLGAWFGVFLLLQIVGLPSDYFRLFGLFILPLGLLSLTYLMTRARLADFSVAVNRLLIYAVMLMLVVVVGGLFIGAVELVKPGFLNPQQIAFAIMLIVAVGLALTVTLPKLLPHVERLVHARMAVSRQGYEEALTGLVKNLSQAPNLDGLLEGLVTTLRAQMRVSRVLVLMQDPLSGAYRVQAQSGVDLLDEPGALDLDDASTVIEWLRENGESLPREELPSRVPAGTRQALTDEMTRLQASVVVPMLDEGRLMGVIALGEKSNREAFSPGDLKALEAIATELLQAVKYRRMEEQVFHSNKLIELGTIAAGVAHEIRNPLASIRTFAQLMPDKMDDPEFKNEFSKLVIKDVDRITKVIESMLAFARPAQGTITEHPAADLVDEAVLLVQPRLKAKRIELTRQFHEKPILRVDKQQILQVLINILSNAADAVPERGKIRVATGVRLLENVGGRNGHQRVVVIEIADNGAGIPPAVRSRLFNPFFTTKKSGTGLGLSISQKICRDHGGIITVSSVEGKGATFQVNLPIASGALHKIAQPELV